MKNILITGCAILLLAACSESPKSPAELTDALNRRYRDRPANEFFVDYGLPAGEFELGDGTHIYRWTSNQRDAVPTAVNFTRYNAPNEDYQLVDTYNGITETHYCELRIYTDAGDIIQKFAVAVDSIGKWSASRCSEIFSNP